jgi:RNA polymerase primary sigma factor
MTEFIFEDSPWQAELDRLEPGMTMPAARFLTIMESETDETLEEALFRMEEKGITLDISSLPAVPATGDGAARLQLEQKLVRQGNLMKDLPEDDLLRLYLEELAQTPAVGDVKLLAEDYLAGNEKAAEKLLTLRLGRAVELAKESTGRGVLLMDLIQEASMGLWQGILRYEGGSFEDHTDWWIRQYLAKAALLQARAIGLGQKLKQGVEDYRDVDQRLLSELGRNPTMQEIADAMHITLQDAQVFADQLTMAKGKQKVEAEEPEETPEDQQAVEDTAYFQSRQRIMDMLSGLSEQEAQLLSLRFGLEGGLPLSPEQTGAKLGLTPNEVVAMEATALEKLRKEN